ncbi:MAG: hypothetical protein HYV09_18640 [Deltaproteobacteria bacterium]|nr:hypothetical protein [Deltaproteobacteria bacterium]
MRRIVSLCAALAVACGVLAASQAAPAKVPLEIWGLEAGDELTIDGVAVNVRGGGAARAFTGDPDATSAPAMEEVSVGRHELAVRRAGCVARTFAVTVETASKRAVVIEPPAKERCTIPFAPPRR